MDPILITGALGNVGSEIVLQMRGQRLPVRAGDVNPAALKSHFDGRTDSVLLDFAHSETFAPALATVKRVFLLRPPKISNVKQYLFPFIDAAKSAGVKQVVFLSLIGIENNQRVPHYKVEDYLRFSGLDYTFLRASFFMQNLSGIHREEIRDRNGIFLPVGHGKTSFIDVRDIAAVAVKTLTEPGHENQAYDLTGPEALDYYQVANTLSNVLGRKIVYRNTPTIVFVWNALRKGKPLGLTLVMSYLYMLTKRGMSDKVTTTVRDILRHDPISFEKFVKDFCKVWL